MIYPMDGAIEANRRVHPPNRISSPAVENNPLERDPAPGSNSVAQATNSRLFAHILFPRGPASRVFRSLEVSALWGCMVEG